MTSPFNLAAIKTRQHQRKDWAEEYTLDGEEYHSCKCCLTVAYIDDGIDHTEDCPISLTYDDIDALIEEVERLYNELNNIGDMAEEAREKLLRRFRDR